MSRTIRLAAAILALGLTSACATIVQGTSQDILVLTDPPGATCALTREGEVLARTDTTPRTVTVSRSHAPITIQCAHPAGRSGGTVMHSTVAAATFGNILAGGLIGVVVDASTGASTTYEREVTIVLAPGGAPATPPADPPPSGARPLVEPAPPPPGPAVRR